MLHEGLFDRMRRRATSVFGALGLTVLLGVASVQAMIQALSGLESNHNFVEIVIQP